MTDRLIALRGRFVCLFVCAFSGEMMLIWEGKKLGQIRYTHADHLPVVSLNDRSGTLFWWWTSIWYLALASRLKFIAYLFGHGATKHKLLSLNVGGIRSFGRRKSILNWLLIYVSPIYVSFRKRIAPQRWEFQYRILNCIILTNKKLKFNCCSRIAKLHFLSRRSGIRRAFTLLLQDIFWLLETCLVLAKR